MASTFENQWKDLFFLKRLSYDLWCDNLSKKSFSPPKNYEGFNSLFLL